MCEDDLCDATSLVFYPVKLIGYIIYFLLCGFVGCFTYGKCKYFRTNRGDMPGKYFVRTKFFYILLIPIFPLSSRLGSSFFDDDDDDNNKVYFSGSILLILCHFQNTQHF